MSDLVSHANSRSVSIEDRGVSPMDRGKLNGSGSVKVDLTFLHRGVKGLKWALRETRKEEQGTTLR